MDQRQFKRAAWFIDVVLFPIFGIGLMLMGALVAAIGRINFDGTELSFAKTPAKFALFVAGIVAVGLALCGYGVVRGYMAARQPRPSDQRPPSAPP
jgi:hypothetical protein